ncbi:hypothetical protein ACIRF8_22495 [Streptomyces sp. NPDC102406]|uniref:hypothetical protein n=1 Tax=Streptomyces sp. NPDC102406 TaxID=3366171 RepID=UPI00382949AC
MALVGVGLAAFTAPAAPDNASSMSEVTAADNRVAVERAVAGLADGPRGGAGLTRR